MTWKRLDLGFLFLTSNKLDPAVTDLVEIKINKEMPDVCASVCKQELGIKNPLHRKKLQLALQSLGSDDDSKSKLDFNWVTRE